MLTEARIDAVVLDCYGTLVHVTEPRGVSRRIAHLVGGRMSPSPMTTDRPLMDMVHEAAPDATPADMDRLREDLAIEVASVRMLPGARDAIDRLRTAGHLVCIASNLAQDYAAPLRLVADDHRFLSFEMGLAKPDPRFFETVVSTIGIAPSRTVMIGDSLRSDVGGARGVGMTPILLSDVLREDVETAPDVAAAAMLPLLQRPPLSRVVGRYVDLEPYGIEFRGRCQGHPDEQKSFFVCDLRGIYHCHACGHHGREWSFRKYVLPLIGATTAST